MAAASACKAYEDAGAAAIKSKFDDYRGLWLQNASSEAFNQQVVVNMDRVRCGKDRATGQRIYDTGRLTLDEIVRVRKAVAFALGLAT